MASSIFRRVVSTVIATAAASVLPAELVAQKPQGDSSSVLVDQLRARPSNRDYGRAIETPENRVDQALRFSAACVYRTVPASARKVLSTEIASADEAKRVKALAGVARACFGIQLDYPATTYRNAIAEAAYRAQFTHDEPTAVAGPPPASFAVVPDGREGTPQQKVAWQLAAIAGCTVFADPRAARDLVLGPRNVDEEQRRFTLLQTAIARCVAGDVAAQLTARNFRGAIGNALLVRAERRDS